MARYIIVAEICESALASSVRYSSIQNAFREAVLPGWGTLVGPGPRVVRGRFDGCSAATATKAAWMIDMPFSADAITAAQYEIQARLLDALEQLRDPNNTERWWTAAGVGLLVISPLLSAVAFARRSGHWDVAFVPYTESMSGPVSWWESGAAGNTRTRDSADSGAKENVIGPDSLLPEQVTLVDRALAAQKQYTDTMTKMLLAISVLLAIVYLGPAVARWMQSRAPVPPLPPPRPTAPPPRVLPPPRRPPPPRRA